MKLSIGGGKMHLVTRTRHSALVNVEKCLVKWMGSQNDGGIPLSTMLIQWRATFEELKVRLWRTEMRRQRK
jgi:hypothetical protein